MASSGRRGKTPREKKAWLASYEKQKAKRPGDEDCNTDGFHRYQKMSDRRCWSKNSPTPRWLQDILDLKPLDENTNGIHGWTEPPYEQVRWPHTFCIPLVLSRQSYSPAGVHVFEIALPSEDEGYQENDNFWGFKLGLTLIERENQSKLCMNDAVRATSFLGKAQISRSHAKEDYDRGGDPDSMDYVDGQASHLWMYSPAQRKILLILDHEKDTMAFVIDGIYTSIKLHSAFKGKKVHVALNSVFDLPDPSKSIPLRYLHHHDRTQPICLMELCRRVVRRGCNREEKKIEKLQIPKELVNYLMN